MGLVWVLFVFVTSCNLLTQGQMEDRQVLIRRYSKGLLMPLLLAIYLAEAAKVSLAVVLALIFAWIGDLFLMGIRKKDDQGKLVIEEAKWMFMMGLFSFLVGHLAYLVHFSSLVDLLQVPRIFYGLLFVVLWYGLIILKGIRAKGIMLIGVMLYMLVIGAMIVYALANFYLKMNLAAAFMALGAILFGSSDSVLAFRKIRGVDLLPNSYIMFSYISGQFLIILGLLG